MRFATNNRAKVVAVFLMVAVFLRVNIASGADPDADDPAAELATFKVAPGFEVNLFASEKDGVVKPIQSRFDANGKLYVIGSTVYPQLKPGQVPDDKVIVLADTDGDGKADQSTVFASGLFIPTGIEIGDGGIYVGNSTEMLHLRDTDGDGRADERRVVLRGFGTGDNHQNLNSFQWGQGGELMFSQGLHSNSRVETPWGIERLDHAGIWRFRPRTMRLDPFFGGEMAPHNPWGFVFDYWGQPLVLAGNGHGIYYPVPVMIRGHRYVNIDQIWQDYRGRKLCGGDIVANAHMPDAWQGVMLAGGFMNNTVYALKVVDDGAGYKVTDLPPLLTSSSTSFRPVDVKMGPDGAVYVTDWYNPIIGHYQASFRHPDRDKVHGRIWRITARGRPLVKQPKLAGASINDLLELLKSEDRFTRYHARRLLADVETGPLTNALGSWIARLDPGDPRLEHHLFEALGVYESHEVVEPALLERLLHARDAGARAYATKVIGHWQDRLNDPLALLRRMAADDHPRVRLEAVVAATYVPVAESLEVVLAATEKPLDKFIDYAARQAVYVLKPRWLPEFAGGKLDLDQHPARLEYLLKADGSTDTTKVLRARLANDGLEISTRETFLGILAETGDAADWAYLLGNSSSTVNGKYDASLHARSLAALVPLAKLRAIKPAGNLAAVLTSLISADNSLAVRSAALRLAGQWKVNELQSQTLTASDAATLDMPLRIAAIEALSYFGGDAAVHKLTELTSTHEIMPVRSAAIASLASLDLATASAKAVELMQADISSDALNGILSAFVTRRGGADSLAAALGAKPPAKDNARLGLRWLNSSGSNEKKLAEVFNKAAGLGGESLRATPEFVNQLAEEVKLQGDAMRGAAVFRREDLSCLSCHSVAGVGGKIGPDLNAIGSGQPLDFIIGAVLEPNKEVKESFEAVEVTTKDGESYTGFRVRGADDEVALREISQNRVMRFRKDSVQSVKDRGSVMPSGLVDHLTRAELRDLFRYLSGLGKVKP